MEEYATRGWHLCIQLIKVANLHGIGLTVIISACVQTIYFIER